MATVRKNMVYAAPKGRYKVHVTHGNWKAFANARLQISMKNAKHTGEKFYAECEWVAQRFEHAQLVVSDTLHRYNIMALYDGVDEDTAHNIALKIGDRWIAENREAINLLDKPHVTRWDDWLLNPQFKSEHQKVLQIYEHNEQFAHQIDTFAELFIKGKDIPFTKQDRYRHLSCAYLLEEITIFSLMKQDDNSMIDIRPGSRLGGILDSMGLNYITIDFTKNKSFQKP